MYIPTDPFILFSWLNTKLRDDYDSLEILCEDLDLDQSELESKMEAIGYTYDPRLNKFM